jgi:mono/diheme cytochrome c family protein
MRFRLIAALALLALLLAACSSATGTLPAGTAQVPGTGSTAAATSATGSTSGTAAVTPGTGTTGSTPGSTAATCEGVDTQALMTAGQTVYSQNCASCHGAQGEGVGDTPALAANMNLTANDVPGVVTKYLAVDAHPKSLTVEDIAGALTFVRGSFGNTASAICPVQIPVPMP